MRNTLLTIFGLIILSACTVHRPISATTTETLLSGERLFGEVVGVSDIQEDHVMALNDELRQYVATKVGTDRRPRARLEKLLGGMIEDGLLALDYNEDNTFSAIETFNTRQGNCLSFSILFAALAREADLELTFQMVDIPPDFRASGEMIFLNNHINIKVQELRHDIGYAMDYIVDFNTADYAGNRATRDVADSYAIALYFGNLAAEAMQNQETREAFRFLKKGIETNPDVLEIWVNLGVLYSQQGHLDLAESAYRQALSINPANRSALMNIASVLTQQDRPEEARYYAQRVQYYRKHHPYYHFSQAKKAFEERRFEDAIESLSTAIELKDNDHQFYFLRGLAHRELQALALARDDFMKARDVAEGDALVSSYSRKLDALKLQ